jgi:hypothetical protein
MTHEPDRTRYRARDTAVRRTRAIVVGVAAGAVALSGACSALAARAFKGHTTSTVTAAPADPAPLARVPGPQTVPPIAGEPAPLQPPAEPPAAAPPEPSAPSPQVSGGS